MDEEKEEFAPLKVKALREFLNNLPEKFDDFSVINGEFNDSETDAYYRIEKAVIHVMVDPDTEDLCILHQSIEEIEEISTEETKEDDTEGTTNVD